MSAKDVSDYYPTLTPQHRVPGCLCVWECYLRLRAMAVLVIFVS